MRLKRVAISTVGCRSNQADSSVLARRLLAYDVDIVDNFSDAQWVVVNTCCVTQEAERDCRKIVRRALLESPKGKIIVMGCAANAIADFGKDLGDRIEIISREQAGPDALVSLIAGNEVAKEVPSGSPDALPGPLGRTRALLKIQNGCTHGCTYCIVPRARGPETSMPESEVREEINSLLMQGYREIVITGVQLGAWGMDLLGAPKLSELIDQIATEIAPGRLRLSSIEPWSVSPKLIESVARHSAICSHLHLPLQSGDDRILESMGRGYTSSDYQLTVNRIKEAIRDVALGTDVIFGFPGEDEAAYSNTMATLEAVGPAYIHGFTYSPRPGTRAADLPDRPSKSVAKQRTGAARDLGRRLSHDFRLDQAGTVRQVLVEETKSGSARGLTDTFIPVELTPTQKGALIPCRLGKPVLGQGRVWAEPI